MTKDNTLITFIVMAKIITVSSCGMTPSTEATTKSPSELTTLNKVTPIVAKPNEIITMTGGNFSQAKNLTVQLGLSNGETTAIPVKVKDQSNASFLMPQGAGLGLKEARLIQGSSRVEIGKFQLISDQQDNTLPILIDAQSEICSTKQYIDRNGNKQTGTKDCAPANGTLSCTSDGASKCTVDGANYVAVLKQKLIPSNLKAGVDIGGVTGSLAAAPALCSQDGQFDCIVAGPNYSAAARADAAGKILQGRTVGGVSGNVVLPDVTDVRKGLSFGSNGSQIGTLDLGAGAPAACSTDNATNCVANSNYPAIDKNRIQTNNSKFLSDFSVAGISGSITPRGNWNVTQAFPGQGFFTGISGQPLAATYSGTLFGTAGTAVLKPGDCSSNGATGCVTTSTYKSADLTNLSAGNIKSTVTIAGVTGNYPSATSPLAGADTTADLSNVQATRESQLRSAANFEFFMSDGTRVQAQGDADIVAANIANGFNIFGQAGGATLSPDNCSSNGQQSCVATSTYPAGQSRGSWNMTTSFPGAGYYSGLTNTPTAASIKSGVAIAGVTGNYPSVTSPLAGASGTDLTTPTFNAQIKSSGTFQYFGSDGTRYTGTGDTDIVNTNIISGVDIFGATGNVTTGASPNAWDLRAGVTVGTVTGKLKVNCRNRVNNNQFNYDNPGIFDIPNTGVKTGTSLDPWDTLDNFNAGISGLPPQIVTGWSDNDCSGVEVTSGDNNVWKDVTTTAAGTASSCAGTPTRCTMQDKITTLWWSKLQGSGIDWATAVKGCFNLTHNGQDDWRLPTQKELFELYNHDIKGAVRTNWITWAPGDTDPNLNKSYWAATSVGAASGASDAWLVNLATGNGFWKSKASLNVTSVTDTINYICVRP